MPTAPHTSRLFKRTAVVVVSIILLSGVSIWAVWAQHRNVEHTREELQRSYEVQEQLLNVFSLIQDAETGQRGYIITGDPAFLIPYEQATPAIASAVAKLKELLDDDDVLLRQVGQLERKIQDKQAEMARTIRIRDNQGATPAIQSIQQGTGKVLMDAIRLNIAQLHAAEEQARDDRRASEQREFRQLVVLFLLVIAAIALTLLISGFIAFNALRLRIASEGALRQQQRQAQGLQRIAEAASLAPTLRHALGSTLAELIHLVNGQQGYAVWRTAHAQPRAIQKLTLVAQPGGGLRQIDHGRVSATDLHGWPNAHSDQGVRIETESIARKAEGVRHVYIPVADSVGPSAMLVLTVNDTSIPASTIESFAIAAATQLAHAAEEQRILDSLNDSLARNQGIFDSAIDGILTIRSDGSIESVNPAALRMFGHLESDASSMHVSQLLPDERLSLVASTTSVSDATGVGSVHETVGQRLDGSRFPVDVALTELQLFDKTLRVAVVRDATERKRLEKIKNEFIATVSHELRTPLTSISGALRLLESGAAGTLPEKAARFAQIAHSNSERLVRLVNDILDIEKIEAGLVEFDIRPLPLHAIAQHALDANTAYAQRYGVTLELQPTTGDTMVLADADRLNQVLTNLLSNAVKFSPENSTVTLSLEEHGNMAKLTVTDHGPGIPAEFQQRMYQKFAQADASDQRSKGGTGLGLSITQQLVAQMHGNISFTTGSGGTSFTVEIPLATPGCASAQPQP